MTPADPFEHFKVADFLTPIYLDQKKIQKTWEWIGTDSIFQTGEQANTDK